jgi:TM2 domain-containing membrane protein YozV
VVLAEPTGPSQGIAAVLSLFIPGAGQLYCGRVGSGLAWLFFVVVGYVMFILPGLVLHIICIVAAATAAAEEGKRARDAFRKKHAVSVRSADRV